MKPDIKKIAFVFPGQGAQYVGMGRNLYDNFKEVRELFKNADDLLGLNLTKLCFEGPGQELKITSICQPAILLVSIATLRVLRLVSPDIAASMTAGLSLGEYSSLVASAVISFEDAIKLVHKRGKFMDEAARINPGQMVSILGLDIVNTREICEEAQAEIANLNCPGQIVVSGTAEAISKVAKLAKDRGAKRTIILEVSGPFHCSLMNPASMKLALELNKLELKTPAIPVISNVTAYFENTAEEIRTNLVNQINHATRWEDSIRLMIDSGVTVFVEIGPGKVISGLIRRIDSSLDIYNIETAQDIDELLQKVSLA